MSDCLDDRYQYMIANSIMDAGREHTRPSFLFRPKIFIDEGKWCALYGDNLQDGVCGFGKSPEEAMLDFDKSWHKKLD